MSDGIDHRNSAPYTTIQPSTLVYILNENTLDDFQIVEIRQRSDRSLAKFRERDA